jgi:hypothetical protein
MVSNDCLIPPASARRDEDQLGFKFAISATTLLVPRGTTL